MQKIEYIVRKDLEPFVNAIMYNEVTDVDGYVKLPLYADGYPGIMFQVSDHGFYLQPKGKLLSEFFLYGQTLHPISLEAKGRSKFIVCQLYPFASKYLLGVDPKILNDECYDLLQIDHIDMESFRQKLVDARDPATLIEIISDVMIELIKHNNLPENDQIQNAINLILKADGVVKINEVLTQMYMSERTFERKFKSQVGLNPKQFARIIQFQKSLNGLNESNFKSLTEVGLDSGFSDQSHFIRTFKSYTGQTPKYYLNQLQA